MDTVLFSIDGCNGAVLLIVYYSLTAIFILIGLWIAWDVVPFLKKQIRKLRERIKPTPKREQDGYLGSDWVLRGLITILAYEKGREWADAMMRELENEKRTKEQDKR